jgi:hypothetical protein
MTRQKKRPGGGVLIWNFAERGCARSVSRRAFKMLRLVSDTAALRSNQDTTSRAGASFAPMALRWILEFPGNGRDFLIFIWRVIPCAPF